MTLKNLLSELSLVEEKEIKRHAKGLVMALEKSEKKKLLDYGVNDINKDCPYSFTEVGIAEICPTCHEVIDFQINE